VVRADRQDTIYNILDPLEPELAGPMHYQRAHPDQPLAQQPKGVEGYSPEVDIRNMDQPQLA
jgi:hypothetical protein